MKVKTNIGVSCASRDYSIQSNPWRINIPFNNTFINYTESDILTKSLVLLSVVWDKNSLLFTKRFHMMNEIIGYSYTRSLMNSIQLCGTLQAYIYVYMSIKNICINVYIIFEKYNTRPRVRKENRAKLFGRFAVCYSIPTVSICNHEQTIFHLMLTYDL